MPITVEELKNANAAMMGHTNRGLLFTTVNLSKNAPCLSKHLSDLQAGIYTWDQFRRKVQDELTVTTFPDFLAKFQPCFYYRLSPPREPISVDMGDMSADAAESGADAADGETTETMEDGAEGETSEAVASVDMSGDAPAEDEFALAKSLPEYEFSLEGGPPELGWKRVPITLDHPLFKNLAASLKERAMVSTGTVDVSVDDALMGFRPQMQENLLRKTAQDFKSISKKLALEAKRNPDSPETQNALEAYDRKLSDLEAAIGDDLRVLPTITSGLATARRALGSGNGGGSGAAAGPYVLEIGDHANVLVKALPPSETLKGLEAGTNGDGPKALESGSNEIVPLRKALERTELAERKVSDIVKMDDDKQYPALVGTLMHDMIRRHKIQPVIGNMLSVVLQDPQQLATWNISPREIEVFHDTFLGIYSMAVENFLKAVVPMFETLMGVYALFNEFPSDVRRGQPELIVTNDEITDLWQTYSVELTTFVRSACLQATKQYKDAVSFAIVPSVAPFKNKAPASPPSGFIKAGDFVADYNARPVVREAEDRSSLSAEHDALRKKKEGVTRGFGKVAGAPEVMGLMQLGQECGFGVFFSPEKQVIAGRTDSTDIEILQEAYCPDTVVDKPWAVSGVMCLPDFVVLPPDGMMFTGKVMDGRSVGVEVPQIVVRSCYVAAGRYMANDNPEVLKSAISKLPLEQQRTMKVRPLLPGLGVDLAKYPVLGKTNLAPDHFLSDHIIRSLMGADKSFLVFSHVHGQSPNIAAQRTLSRVRTDYGERYVRLHHWRQQLYLSRLFYTAYHMGFGGAWPDVAEMDSLMDKIVNWMNWYDLQREGYVNAFPSELEGDIINVEPITEGGQVVSFVLRLPLKAAVIGPLELITE